MAENSTLARIGLSKEKQPEPAAWELAHVDRLPTVEVPISSLVLNESPRQCGESADHVEVLAESEAQLPPIVVHGQSMRVIDGMHRVRAAVLRGEEKIEARIYHGTDDDAFVLAVRLNIAHGLPLTRADRTAAATRIIRSHPQWSNRMIASATGLSAGTVGKVRRRSTVQNGQSTTRVGRDGRRRPLDGTVGRVRASELLTEKPAASIRAIALEAGVSPSTVHDVRQRILNGQEPAVPRPRAPEPPAADPPPDVYPPRRSIGHAVTVGRADTILASLKADPSLRFNDAGRSLIRWLDAYRLGMTGSNKIIDMVPVHCAFSVAKLARGYARMWTEIAAQLEQRGNSAGPAFAPASQHLETPSKPG
jgi:ParB-like chromosome segregation protein Spo0J